MIQTAGHEEARHQGGPGAGGQELPKRLTRAGRTTLLIVDDIAENLFALAATLKRDDVDILTARSGREALELLIDRPVAVAILDVQMPEMDGFELATLMRGVEKTRHVPIIFVTAGSRDQRRVFEGYEAGAVDFLFKPIDSLVLRSKVDVFVTLEKQRHALRRSEERFRSLVEATSQAVWTTAGDGSIAVDSPSFRELTGMQLRDWFDGGWLDTIHPEDREQVAAKWRQAQKERAPHEVECRIRRPDGQYTWTQARMAPVFDDSGELVEWVGAIIDIEERKQAENLREMFVAILSHDLRNPLGAMLMSTQLVLSRVEDEQVRKPLARALSSGKRMSRMIEQLLDLTRVRLGGGIDLAPVVVDLSDVVHQALGEIVKGKDRFQVATTGDTTGTWDVDRIFQVVSNLASNAVEHSPAGTPVQVRIDGGRPDAVELAVHNLGAAVPTELRNVLFEPFRGLKEGRRGASSGLGLGLFITKQLVLAHEGALTFETQDDSGTTFFARLPRHTRTRA